MSAAVMTPLLRAGINNQAHTSKVSLRQAAIDMYWDTLVRYCYVYAYHIYFCTKKTRSKKGEM